MMNCSRFGPILAPVGATGLGESASVAGVVTGLVTKGLLGLGFSLRELSVLSVEVLTWTFIVVQAYNRTGSQARRQIRN